MLSVEWEENGFQYGGILNHFVDVNKSTPVPKGGPRIIEDLLLTRYAWHLFARNGNPRKEENTTPGVLL